MIFLIQFDRSLGKRVRFERFEDTERERAVPRRLELEIDAANANLDHEVVLLEADDEEQLRQTHRRYFESVESLHGALRAIQGAVTK